MKPLLRCCNGCDAPPQPPSKVLCAACFTKLDARFHALAKRLGNEPPDVTPARPALKDWLP